MLPCKHFLPLNEADGGMGMYECTVRVIWIHNSSFAQGTVLVWNTDTVKLRAVYVYFRARFREFSTRRTDHDYASQISKLSGCARV